MLEFGVGVLSLLTSEYCHPPTVEVGGGANLTV